MQQYVTLCQWTHGSRALAPKSHPSSLSPLLSCKLTLVASCNNKPQCSYLSATRNMAWGNIKRADFLICSLVSDLGKTWQISQILWTETDLLVNKDVHSASLCGASLSYTSTAVLMKLQLSQYNQKKAAVLNPEVTIIKLIESWQVCQNMHQDKHPFLSCRSNATAGLSVSCDSPEVCVTVKRD